MGFKPNAARARKKLPFWKDKAKRNISLIGGFIIFIMIASALGMYGSDDETEEQGYEYKGVTFVDTGTGWLAHLDSGEQLMISSNPQRLENLTGVGAVNLNNFKYVEKVYLTQNPEDNIGHAIREFFRVISIEPRTVPACSADVPGCEELPIRVCDNASMEYGVIEFRKANESSVTFKNNCLLLEGESLLEVVDKFILEMKL